ncbi:hypothetical protein SN11_14075 [Vibrio harveyi]|nr:hypothetical protein SN11_14075 [Vibrio harveyi]
MPQDSNFAAFLIFVRISNYSSNPFIFAHVPSLIISYFLSWMTHEFHDFWQAFLILTLLNFNQEHPPQQE